MSFVVCLSNRGYRASLMVRRLYPVVPDPNAESHRMLRVVDESGEDYLYPERMFGAVDLSRTVEKKLASAR
ncbi:MAG TPA: hypothetical protein VJ826_09950 [Candidatus Polarisedimenticolaceae bacterium]|nr:hypothetical protein [Candidatus Polarisedimenticolaceae bacterium]